MADSYDLVVKIRNTSSGKEHWYWQGVPMRELSPVQKRVKRARKVHNLLAWKIVLMRLDQDTGEVVQSIVEEGV